MGNAARKLTNRLHFLALNKLALQRFKCCGIYQNSKQLRPVFFHYTT